MIRSLFIAIVLGSTFISCTANRGDFRKKDSLLLFKKQQALNKGYAIGAKWGRHKALDKKVFNYINKFDTLWAIERVEEVGSRVLDAAFWDNSREKVVRYSEVPDFKNTNISYREFKDPLIAITERFDTLNIAKRRAYIGAPYVFISRITKDKIETYFFPDITPLDYFKE